MPQPLSTRLSPDLPSGELVIRVAVIEKIVAASSRVVLVSAPAGSGKTTSLAQWAAADPRPHVWLRLDAGDNDLVELARDLVSAGQEVIQVDAAVLALLEEQLPLVGEVVLPAFLRCTVASRPFVFVIDDLHLVRNPACLDMLTLVIESLPPGATMALGTRVAPNLPLARWRAAGRLTEVGMRDLAFDLAEAGELLADHEVELSKADLATLLRQTEGWATGVSLASMIARGRPAAAWLPHIHGDQREIAAYLLDEVLHAQPDDIQDFLMRTSILDPLCAAACGAVTQRSDSQAVLEYLANANLFVAPLGERHEWFRCHRFFADLLQQQLTARLPGDVPALHAAAAAWYEASGDVLSAVRHRLASGETDAAADLASEGWIGFVSQGRYETVRRMMSWFTTDQVLAHGPLTVACGWVHLADGEADVAGFWGQAAARLPMVECDSDRWGWMCAAQALLRAVVAQSVQEMLAHATAAAHVVETPSQQWHQNALLWLGIAQWLCGVDEASATLEEAARDGRHLNPAGDMMSRGILALVAEDEGDWRKAATLVGETMSRANVLGLAEHRVNGFGLQARARLLAHMGDPAECDARRAVALVLEGMPAGTWMGLPAATTLTGLALQRGDVDEAVRWSAKADAILLEYPEAGIMRDRALRLREMVMLQRLATPLSPAERRVLDYLPTQFSRLEIAAQLLVSPATVNTQLRSIYTKLGVNSRTGAVERARESGLLKTA